MTLERSNRLLAAAKKVIPGGVDSPVRAFRAVGGEPPCGTRMATAMWTMSCPGGP